jgi:hypothetical protein
MWRLDTDKGSYASKQLSKDIDLKNERVIKNYEFSEKIASRFSALGIPDVPAIENTGQYLFMIEETGFLVYPWVDAKALDQHAVSEHHALKIATILAKMHYLNLDEPEITQPEFYTHTDQNILELAVIDFGGAAVGDPACDLVIAWTYLSGKAREIFISKMDMDPDTWLRARAWALWKATFELCQTVDKNSTEALLQKRIIDEVMNGR